MDSTNGKSHFDSDDPVEKIGSKVRAKLGGGALARTVATEVTTWYYLLRSPRGGANEQVDVPDESRYFTYYRNSGMTAMLLVFLMIIAVEVVVLHLLLAKVSHLLAWPASLSTIYCATLVVAQCRAIRCRPLFVNNSRLFVRNGMFNLFSSDLDEISSAEVARRDVVKKVGEEEPLHCCFPVSHNVVIHLNQPVEATLMYGKTRHFQTALLYADDPQGLVEAIVGNRRAG